MNFDWRTDEEESWTPRQEPPAAPPPNRRRLFALLIALAAVALAMAYVYRQAQQRIAATEQAVTGDVLASHELVTTAARTGDAEMLRSVLSGADDDWAAAQIRRVAGAPHAGRLAFGLQPLGGEEPPPEVVLNPEMRAAELTWVARYVVTDSAGVTSTVQLTQTAVYRRGSNNWLLAPPPAAFWQGSDEFRGDYLEAIYPGRDEAIATRLARGLDAVLTAICRSGCPAGFRLRLILSPDPASFSEADTRTLLAARRTAVLPTPTLVGLPVDDAAYAALERGYAVLLTTAVLADLAGYDCCHNAFYAGAWVHWYQHLRGLRAWPLDAEAYEAMLLNLPSTDELTGFLGANPRLLPELTVAHWGPVYAFVQFLYEAYGPAGVSSPLHAPPGNALDMLGIGREQWAQAWPRFVYEKSLSGQRTAPPTALPEADLALQCSREGVQIELRRLDLQDGATRPLYENSVVADVNWPAYAWTEPLGTGNGLVLIRKQRLTEGDDAGRFEFAMRLIGDEQSATIFRALAVTLDELPLITPERSDPAGRYLVLGDYSPGQGPNPTQPRYFLVDLATCNDENCGLHEIPGYVRWSPAGAHTLVVGINPATDRGRFAGAQIYEGDGAAGNLRPVGRGHAIVWLDDTHYAYAALPPEEPELVVRVIGQDVPLLRFSLAEIWTLAGIGDARPLNTTVLDYVLVARPDDPTRLLLSATIGVPGSRENTLFLVQLTPELDGVLASTLLAGNLPGFAFSPTGRWLSLYRAGTAEAAARLELLDLEATEPTTPVLSREARPFGTTFWAPDRDWLAFRGENYLLLYDPAAGYTHFVPLDTGQCYAYGWVE